MDGAAAAALIIIIVFVSNLSIKPFTPALKEPSPVVQKESTPTITPAQQAAAQTSTQASTQTTPFYEPVRPAPAIPNLAADHSPAAYQYVDSDRMEVIIRKYNRNIPQSEVEQIKTAINKYSREKNLDPRLILAVIARESGFNPYAVSTSGAIGLGQIMPYNYDNLGISNPNDIDQNVRGTVYYLWEKMMDWRDQPNQLELGIASYTKGTGDIRRANGQFDAHTQSYVDSILKIRASI